VSSWAVEEFRALRLEEIDVRYARYRLSVLEAEETMARSLRRYGQISPVVVCLREEAPVLIDGFKRLAAARGLKGFGTLPPILGTGLNSGKKNPERLRPVAVANGPPAGPLLRLRGRFSGDDHSVTKSLGFCSPPAPDGRPERSEHMTRRAS
jgi:hypothetical protein